MVFHKGLLLIILWDAYWLKLQHTHTQAHTNAHTRSLSRTHIHTHTHLLTHTRLLTHSLTHSHTHTNTQRCILHICIKVESMPNFSINFFLKKVIWIWPYFGQLFKILLFSPFLVTSSKPNFSNTLCLFTFFNLHKKNQFFPSSHFKSLFLLNLYCFFIFIFCLFHLRFFFFFLFNF